MSALAPSSLPSAALLPQSPNPSERVVRPSTRLISYLPATGAHLPTRPPFRDARSERRLRQHLFIMHTLLQQFQTHNFYGRVIEAGRTHRQTRERLCVLLAK
ncbi:hypothetical protein VTO73DRAFT_14508 [Trametes versicolor]